MSSKDAIQTERGVGPDGLLRGKVAKLLNARQLAINLGSSQGVKRGMQFAVLNRNAGAIRDPDSQKVLGSVALPKVHIEITFVDDEFSVADVMGTRYRPGGLVFPSWLLSGALGGEEPLTLRRSEHPGVEEIEEKDSIVKVGDPLVQIQVQAAKS